MTEPSEEIIAERLHRPRPAPARLPGLLALGAACWGVLAALVYAGQELTLSHYDAKAHLVVARRVIDSLTPGWEQIGAVWLPLPHLLNLLPVQVDAFYRSGASGVAISIASFSLLVYGSARLVLFVTGSGLAAGTAALLLATNPNILYLQSTPMTEPLLLGLLAIGLALLCEGAAAADPRRQRGGAIALTLACLTRYEAWPVTAAALLAVALAGWRSGRGREGLRSAARLAVYPVAAIAWFSVHSKLTVGAWFVTGGFYVPDPRYLHHPVAVSQALWVGVERLGSRTLAIAAVAAVVALVVLWARRRVTAGMLVPLAWTAAAALPWYAFFQGHPFRVRYMVPLVAASIVVSSIGIGLLPRLRKAAALLLVAGIWISVRPFDSGAAMVREAQWDRKRTEGRRAVTACLPSPDAGEPILMSMGALAHYMQELSRAGFDIANFVHEGNGEIWRDAVERPARHVRWLVVDEFGEGGDLFAERARKDASYLAGFTRRCRGGGVALYERRAARPPESR